MARLPRLLASPLSRITVILCGLASSLLGLATTAHSLECADYDCLPLIGSTASNGARDVAVSGDYAYVAEYLGSLRVVDIADPSAPISVATVPTAGSANGVAIMGSYAYVAESSGLRVIDISNPLAPAVVGSVGTPEAARDVAVANGHAYLAAGSGMQVVDISNPQSPAIVGSAVVVDHDALIAYAVAVRGSYVYLAAGWLDEFGGFVHVIDVANPAAPVVTSTVNTSGSARGVGLTETHAYVTDRSLLLVLSIGEGSATIVEYVELYGDLEGVTISGNYVYVANGSSGLEVMDISNPQQPILTKHRETPGYASSVAVGNDHVFIADGSALQVADFTHPCPQTMGRLDTSDAWDVVVAGDFAYIADSSSGMKVVDIANPEVPVMVGNLATPGPALGVTVVGGFAYVACGNSGLIVANIANPNSPQIVGSVDTPGSAFAVKKVGNFAYVADLTGGLRIIDVSTPTAPSIVGGVNTPGDARGVAITGQYAIVVDHSFRVINISNPSSPIIIGTMDFPFGGMGLDVDVQGTLAFVPGHQMFYVVDFSNPVLPSLVAEAGVAGTADDIAIAGIYAYLASSQAGLQVVDVSSPLSPVSIGGIDTADNARGVAATGDLAIVASSFSGLWVFPAQCATTASVSDPNATPAFVIVQNHPNPFSEFTTFQYQLPTANQVDLRIYDIGGRLVRVLEANARKESGEHVIRWDGRDGKGRRMPAGVYLGRIEAGIYTGTRRVVLLK